MLKNKKEFGISFFHVDIISFIAVIVGIYGIIHGVKEANLNILILILSTSLTIASAIDVIGCAKMIIEYRIIKKTTMPIEYYSKSINSKDELSKFTVFLVVLTIIVLLLIILNLNLIL